VEPSSAIEGALRASHLFGRLGPGLLAELARSAVRRRFSRGELLWRAGAPAIHFTVILHGLVEITRRSASGDDAIIAIFGPRESIGDTAALGAGTYPANAVAITEPVEVLLVPASPVLNALRSNPEVAAAINTALLEHTRALQAKIGIMTAGAVPKRLATLLLHLLERFGDEAEDGTSVIPVNLSRMELARLIGATVETTIRAMSLWQKQGLVRTTPNGFVVTDPAALATVIAAEGGADRGD
jgi:CRP-like cAMP-binding protein